MFYTGELPEDMILTTRKKPHTNNLRCSYFHLNIAS